MSTSNIDGEAMDISNLVQHPVPKMQWDIPNAKPNPKPKSKAKMTVEVDGIKVTLPHLMMVEGRLDSVGNSRNTKSVKLITGFHPDDNRWLDSEHGAWETAIPLDLCDKCNAQLNFFKEDT